MEKNENNQIKLENKIERELNIEKISWQEDNLDLNDNNTNNDYKSVIGQLYNNSRLPDPYEQNKYQTFKEIFPASSFKEKEKTSLNNKELEQEEEKIKKIIESSEDSNIDCEDIRNLNNLYNLQGIQIRIHDKKLFK